MGAIKNMMLEWMEAKELSQNDLNKMENVNKEFWNWFDNERIAKPDSFFDPDKFKPLPEIKHPK